MANDFHASEIKLLLKMSCVEKQMMQMLQFVKLSA